MAGVVRADARGLPSRGVDDGKLGGDCMELFFKLLLAAVLVLLLFRMWPAFKSWQENGPKAQKGDWAAVVLPLAGVAGLVVILVLMVR